jgi:hypothetical protein
MEWKIEEGAEARPEVHTKVVGRKGERVWTGV